MIKLEWIDPTNVKGFFTGVPSSTIDELQRCHEPQAMILNEATLGPQLVILSIGCQSYT